VKGEFDVFGFVTGGEDLLEAGHEVAGQVNVEYAASDFVVEMGVFAEIWAVARGFALDVDLAHQAGADEGFEAVINRGQGDGGHVGAGAGVNFVRGGVVAFVEQDGEDVLALARRTLAGAREGVAEGVFGGGGEFHGDRGNAVKNAKVIGMIPKINRDYIRD
jgi:hypothetical protein